MRSDTKIPPIWTIINNRQYIGWLESHYCWWHKRNFITVKCLECWREVHIESKWFWNYWCKCNQLKSIKEKHWFAHKWQNNRFYNIFCWIKSRCKWTAWLQWRHLYFWKWIKCEWKTFESFRDDMYESYLEHVAMFWEKNTSIDRIDGNWNYCKANCRWATCKEQSENTSRALIVIIDWKEYRTKDISEMTWIAANTARQRLRNYLDWTITQEQLFKKNKMLT